VRTVGGRILVHAAHDALLAQVVLHAQLLDYFVDFQQNGTVERIVVERIQRLKTHKKRTGYSSRTQVGAADVSNFKPVRPVRMAGAPVSSAAAG